MGERVVAYGFGAYPWILIYREALKFVRWKFSRRQHHHRSNSRWWRFLGVSEHLWEEGLAIFDVWL